MQMKISRISCYEVVVPAKAGVISSATIDKPLHKLPVGGTPGWSIQFDKLPKLLVKLELDCGIIGWGELYRGHSWAVVESISQALLGRELESLALQKLPFAFCREYDGFECAVWDAYGKAHNMRIVDMLGGERRNKVEVSAWSSHRTVEDIAELATRFFRDGYRCIKFKCDLEDNIIGWCRTIAEVAPGMQVILDPN